ncbi:MAG: hypothetical protein KZQ93_15025 [Candidatus Thiodiazotropha sp. (ex Monitilora ramsayi)]|nr:hypothetical protein [Candidatus Thiodiazotropha sp. (ex Monitilora ramsayi)]
MESDLPEHDIQGLYPIADLTRHPDMKTDGLGLDPTSLYQGGDDTLKSSVSLFTYS